VAVTFGACSNGLESLVERYDQRWAIGHKNLIRSALTVNSRDFPVIPCSGSWHLIRQTRGDRVTAGFSVVFGLKRVLKNRKFPVNSLFSGYSVEQGSPMTAPTAIDMSLIYQYIKRLH
jgi:hypothetical protein